jgi:Tfp pilus assembly protein PilF
LNALIEIDDSVPDWHELRATVYAKLNNATKAQEDNDRAAQLRKAL